MSNLTLIIGNKNYSSWSLRPWFFLKQNDIDFAEKRIPLFTPETNATLAQYNSDFKVPVLKDSDLLVWDSLAIMEYVSETYLQSGGWPEDASARAMARSTSSEMHSSFISVRSEMPMNCRKTFQGIKLSTIAEQEIERIQALWRQCRTRFDNDGEWLFGKFSIADAMFAPIALRFNGYSIPLGDVEQTYVQYVLQQPCIVEWIEAGKIEKEIIEEDEIELQD